MRKVFINPTAGRGIHSLKELKDDVKLFKTLAEKK
tara:strand:+ start:80 stop:184 length:105 start_codon:yes stop_codon:yes gene_type:complete